MKNYNEFTSNNASPHEKLMDALHAFGIEATLVAIHEGSALTRYEVALPVGVRFNKVTRLARELAAALGSESVAITAPIPGKSTIGIDVQNDERKVLHLSDCWKTPMEGELPIYLGSGITGDIISTDLAKAPHMIIAGTTGSGKSVFLNSLLCTLIQNHTKEDVAFLMIDLKMVELAKYKGIPQLITPIETNAQMAVQHLETLVSMMGNRYGWFEHTGCENIEQFNEKVALGQVNGHCKMARVVVIIDELADLMLSVWRNTAEVAISFVAQKARAAGIHLVLATQRPSTDIITGVIKANMPSRVAFTTASKTDSRVILDVNGAEELAGAGDMLFKSATSLKPVRVQAPYVSPEDITRVVTNAKRYAVK